MIIVSRNVYEAIQIGPDITVTLVKIQGDKVSLGITAPRNVPVHREEIWADIQRTGKDHKAI